MHTISCLAEKFGCMKISEPATSIPNRSPWADLPLEILFNIFSHDPKNHLFSRWRSLCKQTRTSLALEGIVHTNTFSRACTSSSSAAKHIACMINTLMKKRQFDLAQFFLAKFLSCACFSQQADFMATFTQSKTFDKVVNSLADRNLRVSAFAADISKLTLARLETLESLAVRCRLSSISLRINKATSEQTHELCILLGRQNELRMLELHIPTLSRANLRRIYWHLPQIEELALHTKEPLSYDSIKFMPFFAKLRTLALHIEIISATSFAHFCSLPELGALTIRAKWVFVNPSITQIVNRSKIAHLSIELTHVVPRKHNLPFVIWRMNDLFSLIGAFRGLQTLSLELPYLQDSYLFRLGEPMPRYELLSVRCKKANLSNFGRLHLTRLSNELHFQA
jgi:hypothetical protein